MQRSTALPAGSPPSERPSLPLKDPDDGEDHSRRRAGLFCEETEKLGKSVVPEPPLRALAHIPGADGWPFVGNSFELLADPKGATERFASRYGPVYRSFAFGGRTVSLLGPEANEFVLLDQDKVFSSAHGWDRLLGRLFPRGLMLLDFDEHRLRRKALSVAFKAGPLKSYLESLNRGIAREIARWGKESADGACASIPPSSSLLPTSPPSPFSGLKPELTPKRSSAPSSI